MAIEAPCRGTIWTDHDDALGTSPALGYHEISIPGLHELPATETNERIREEIAEFVSLRRARDAP